MFIRLRSSLTVRVMSFDFTSQDMSTPSSS